MVTRAAAIVGVNPPKTATVVWWLKDRPVARARAGNTSGITEGSAPKYVAFSRPRTAMQRVRVRNEGAAVSRGMP